MKPVLKQIAVFFLFSVPSLLLGVSPDEENLGVVIDENKFNLQYINVCMSNLSPPIEEKKDAQGNVIPPTFEGNSYFDIMKKANQLDFNGSLWYFQANYSKASKQLHDSQILIQEMYKLGMERYLQNTRALLEYAAPAIIRTKDAVAKNLLRLGFRELKFAQDRYTRGFNEAPHQSRKKIVLFADGIAALRKARRFAILALIASRTPDEDKDEFRFVSLDEMKHSGDIIQVSDYARIKNKLRTLVTNKMIEQKIVPLTGTDKTPVDIFEMHDDNYMIITEKRVSLLQESTRSIKPDDGMEKETVPQRPDKEIK